MIARLDVPGPVIVRFLPIKRAPLVNVIVAGYIRLKLMVSPGLAAAIASRNVPAPLLFVLVTVMVLPKTGDAVVRIPSSIKLAHTTRLNLILDGIIRNASPFAIE